MTKLLRYALCLILTVAIWGGGHDAIAAPSSSAEPASIAEQPSVLDTLDTTSKTAEPSSSNDALEPAVEPDAEAIFRRAYDNRYTWDENFPGYQAEVSVRYEGNLYQGLVRVYPDFGIEIGNIENDNVNQLIASQLQMSITHLKRVPFEARHEQHCFELIATEPTGAAKIQQLGDESDSSYKVKNGQIKQVNRTIGDFTVKVDTLGSIQTPEGYIPTHFQVVFSDARTDDVLEEDDVRDFYEKIGSYYLLTNRDIRFGLESSPRQKPISDINLRFNDIQPLPTA